MPSLLARARRLSIALIALALLAPTAASASWYADSVDRGHPLHWWRLGELPDATVAADAGVMPAAFAGAGVRFGERGAIGTDGDTAARFDGLTVPGGAAPPVMANTDSNPLGWSQLSWEAWVKPTTLDANSRRVIAAEDSRGGVLLAARRDGIVFSRYSRAETTTWNTLTAPIRANRWNHVVASFQNQTMELYVNGELAASRPSALAPVISRSLTPVVLGSNRGGWVRYDGWLDEVAVYETPLTADEVYEHNRLGRMVIGT